MKTIKGTYLVNNHFAKLALKNKIEGASNDELFSSVMALMTELNQTAIKKDSVTNISEVGELKEMVSKILKSQNNIEHYTENFYRMLETTGDVKPIKPPVKKKLTFSEQIKVEVEKRKAAETQAILKQVYQKIV